MIIVIIVSLQLCIIIKLVTPSQSRNFSLKVVKIYFSFHSIIGIRASDM